jgi:putative restriction endonuclease
MARTEKLSNTKWRHPFRDRERSVCSWKSHPEVAKYCKFQNGTKRLLIIEFEKRFNLVVKGCFRISSGFEVLFPKHFQDVIYPIIMKNPDSYFIVHVRNMPGLVFNSSEETIKARLVEDLTQADILES